MTNEELEAKAERAYDAFCAAASSYLPSQTPLFSELPSVLKEAWKAVAALE